MRHFALALTFAIGLIATGPGQARADAALTPAQTKAVEHIIHDYLVAHPEVLMEAIAAAENKDKAKEAARAEQTIHDRHAEIYDDPDGEIGGNPKGDVTIVEFFDYRCPYCKEVQPSLDAFLKQDGKVRIVYKEFPILGPASVFGFPGFNVCVICVPIRVASVRGRARR